MQADPVRGAPWSNEAEQAVLGAMLLDQDAAIRGVELLDDALFYREGHRRLFRAMRRLIERRVVIDHVTLRDELERNGELEAAGGEVYLAELIDAAVTAANLEAHAGIVREKAVLRQLIEVSTAVISQAYEAALPANELLDQAESRIFQIAEHAKAESFSRIKEMLWPAMERMEKLHDRKETITGVPSGFKDLDELTLGFQPSDLVIVAARPSMGKTAFVLNIAAHAAAHASEPDAGRGGVAIFSLEMSKESLVQRLLASEAQVDSHKLRQGSLGNADFAALARAAGFLSSCPIWIDDTPALTLLEMRAKARRLRMESSIGLIIVDYLQLMRSPQYAKDRVQEISDISRSLKALARELEVPVVALSQLSRASEQRGGERVPILSDLRDSGAIEQDADLVIFIHRPEMYLDLREKAEKEGKDIRGKAIVELAKHRNGPTGPINLYFRKEITRFENFSERPGPDPNG
ncbi:MAG TPA: replicative DNA helicase [Gemmatimonadales bacterium]